MFDTWQSALSGRRVAAWLATPVAAVMALAVLSGTAAAGTYSIYSCAGPSGQAFPNHAWVQSRSVPSHTAAFTFGSACPDLSVVAAPGTTLAAGEDAGYSFTAPPGTTIAGYEIRRSVNITYPVSGTHPTLSAGLRRASGGSETYALECSAVINNCNVAASGTQSVGISANQLQVGVECAQTSTSCAGSGIGTLRATLINSRIDLADNHAPTLQVTGGSLPGASGTSGARGLDVTINDIGGGVKNYWLAVDGVKVEMTTVPGSCIQTYTEPVPCPGERSASYSVDLASYAPGSHTAIAYATDAAGNVGALAPVTFTVPGTVVSNGSPAVEFPTLKTTKSLISVKSTRRVAVRGVLRTAAGRAIGGATLEVSAWSLGPFASTPKVIGSVKTAADGSFSYKAKPNGALRIMFVFRPGSGAEGTATASTTLRQAISLSARRSRAKLRRGASFSIAGRLSGAGRAASGTPVEIQVKNGKRWSTVATVAASKSGSYRWNYRFKRVTRPTLFTFRAIVRSRQDWPWPSRTSSSVRVLVLG